MKYIFFVLFVLIAPVTMAQNNTVVPPNNSMIQYSGRIDFSNPLAPQFDWPGISITAAFHGTTISFLLKDPGNDYDVFVDNEPATVWVTSPDQTRYTLGNLTNHNHVVKIVKRTEALFGLVTFEGLVLTPGETLLNPPGPSGRRIELVGDSYLCGYGVESTSANCNSMRPYENADKSFGALLARDLNAEYHVIAFSGKGVVRNYGAKQESSIDPFPIYYNRTLCQDPKSVWNFNSWIPDMVIIHLGLNDFSTSPQPNHKKFADAYIKFLKHIRHEYPRAVIFCAAPSGWPFFAGLIGEIVENRNISGDRNVHSLIYPPPSPDEFGCDDHPNVVAQRKIAEVLLPTIKKTMYW